MSTPDQLDALRAHLDDALAGVGSHLPGDAAPALLQTARRRTRTKRLAATAGSAVVIAALVIGVGSQVTTNAGHKPTIIGPATAPPSPAATGQATPQPSTAGAPSAPTSASAPKASTAPLAGVQVVAQRQVDPTLLAQPSYTEQTFGDQALFLGPGAGTSTKTPGQLVSLDLETGDQGTLVTGLTRPLGGFTEVGGNVYVAQAVSGKPVVNEYAAADGAKVRTLSLPASTSNDCNPTTSCLSDQVTGTSLVGSGTSLVISTPATDTSSSVETFDTATGAVISSVNVPQQNLAFRGVIGGTVYLANQGQLTAITAGKVAKTTPLTGGDGSFVTVTSQGIYYTSRSDSGGPDPNVPITLTLKRLDPVTLQVTASISETLAKGVVSTPGLSVTVVNKILYSTIGTCVTAPTTDVCVSRRNPITLAIEASDVLRVPAGAKDEGSLVTSSDGTAALSVAGFNPNTETLSLLGDAPAG